jgi:hypothetical protein
VSPPPEEEPAAIDRRVAKLQAELKDEARALNKVAAALAPLTKPKTYEDLGKIPGIVEKMQKKLQGVPMAAMRGQRALNLVREDVAARKTDLRQRLARDLQEICRQTGLELRVIKRDEPIEVRIPPFGVLIDREKGRAQLVFAKQPVAECDATAAAIAQAHATSMQSMSHGFLPETFLEACYRAWCAACGAGFVGSSERVEILDFLPYLAIQMQSRAFRVDPSRSNYRGYTRARFAFDMHQLRKAGKLSHGGHRLNLGVATGTTASKKNRAVWIEDENGEGEFKLTIFFTNDEGAR